MPFKKIIYSLIIIIGFTVTASSLIVFALPNLEQSSNYNPQPEIKGATKVTLEFWGLWDNSDDWREIIDRYEKEKHYFEGRETEVEINYFKKTPADYERDLKNAFEKNQAPDIFMVNQNWLPRYLNYLEPLPNDNISQENYQLVSYKELIDNYPAQLVNDIIYPQLSPYRKRTEKDNKNSNTLPPFSQERDSENQIYSLPFYSDSLALFYNKDIFERAEIDHPPATWKEFKETVKKLTKFDRKNNFIQTGAAIGGGKNINRSSDLLALLMMQNGASVINRNSKVDINREIIVNTPNGTEEREAGKMAINFYTDFANPDSKFYTWNNKQENSIDAFANGKTAMMFNYQYQTKNLLVKNPELNYGIAPMVQIENSTPINFSNYWLPVVKKDSPATKSSSVLKKTETPDTAKIAWSFLSFASRPENVALYLNSTGKAAARNNLIAEQIKLNNFTSIFAAQAASARSFYKPDNQIDFVLEEMIDKINSNRENWEKIVDESVEKIEKIFSFQFLK